MLGLIRWIGVLVKKLCGNKRESLIKQGHIDIVKSLFINKRAMV